MSLWNGSEGYYRLDMSGLWEEIEAADAVERESGCGTLEVASKRGRITGDVDDPGWRVAQKRLDDCRVYPRSRRIEDDEISRKRRCQKVFHTAALIGHGAGR